MTLRLSALLIDGERADRAGRVGEGAEVEFLDLVIVDLGRQRQFRRGAGVQYEGQSGRRALRRLRRVERRLEGRRVAHQLVGQDELLAGAADGVEVADQQ